MAVQVKSDINPDLAGIARLVYTPGRYTVPGALIDGMVWQG